MSQDKVTELQQDYYCVIGKCYRMEDWKAFLSRTEFKQNQFLVVFFFRKCKEELLYCQDSSGSMVLQALVQSQLFSTFKQKCLKILASRLDLNCKDSTGRTVLDYLVEFDDCNCITALMHTNHDVHISDGCLKKAFHCRNQHEEMFKLLASYAIKHNIAPHLTGIKDGDTFLHKIMLHEKDKQPFKKWLLFLLSFPEIDIGAVNSDALTAFDLLFINFDKKRCKYAIKCLFIARFPNVPTTNGLIEFPEIPVRDQTAKRAFNISLAKYCYKRSFKMLRKLVINSGDDVQCDTACTGSIAEVETTSSKSRYIKSKHVIKYLSRNLFKNNGFGNTVKSTTVNDQIMIPNEEIDIPFELKVESEKIVKQNKSKRQSQNSLIESAKVKMYLSSKEAIAYNTLPNNKKIQAEIKSDESNASNDSGYVEDNKSQTDEAVIINEEVCNILHVSSTVSCCTKISFYDKLLHCKYCIKDLTIFNEEIGRGSYGKVCSASYEGRLCVVKEIHREIYKNAHGKFHKEIDILSSLDHPNIVHFLGVFYKGKTPLLVMEKLWADLYTWLEKHLSTSYCIKDKILYHIACGLEYMHSQNIVHGDLTAKNILLTKDLHAKIGDFGMAEEVGKHMTCVPGNPAHMPPEAFLSKPDYTTKLDVFSFGCVIIHTFTHQFPLPDTSLNYCCPLPNTEMKEIAKRSKYLKDMECYPDMYSISLACLCDNPENRPDASQLSILLKSYYKSSSHTLLNLKNCSVQLKKVCQQIWSKICKCKYLRYYDFLTPQSMFLPIKQNNKSEVSKHVPVHPMLMPPEALQPMITCTKKLDAFLVGCTIIQILQKAMLDTHQFSKPELLLCQRMKKQLRSLNSMEQHVHNSQVFFYLQSQHHLKLPDKVSEKIKWLRYRKIGRINLENNALTSLLIEKLQNLFLTFIATLSVELVIESQEANSQKTEEFMIQDQDYEHFTVTANKTNIRTIMHVVLKFLSKTAKDFQVEMSMTCRLQLINFWISPCIGLITSKSLQCLKMGDHFISIDQSLLTLITHFFTNEQGLMKEKNDILIYLMQICIRSLSKANGWYCPIKSKQFILLFKVLVSQSLQNNKYSNLLENYHINIKHFFIFMETDKRCIVLTVILLNNISASSTQCAKDYFGDLKENLNVSDYCNMKNNPILMVFKRWITSKYAITSIFNIKYSEAFPSKNDLCSPLILSLVQSYVYENSYILKGMFQNTSENTMLDLPDFKQLPQCLENLFEAMIQLALQRISDLVALELSYNRMSKKVDLENVRMQYYGLHSDYVTLSPTFQLLKEFTYLQIRDSHNVYIVEDNNTLPQNLQAQLGYWFNRLNCPFEATMQINVITLHKRTLLPDGTLQKLDLSSGIELHTMRQYTNLIFNIHMIKKCPYLKDISLSDNYSYTLPFNTVVPQRFQEVVNLKILDFSNNSISNTSKFTTLLQELQQNKKSWIFEQKMDYNLKVENINLKTVVNMDYYAEEKVMAVHIYWMIPTNRFSTHYSLLKMNCKKLRHKHMTATLKLLERHWMTIFMVGSFNDTSRTSSKQMFKKLLLKGHSIVSVTSWSMLTYHCIFYQYNHVVNAHSEKELSQKKVLCYQTNGVCLNYPTFRSQSLDKWWQLKTASTRAYYVSSLLLRNVTIDQKCDVLSWQHDHKNTPKLSNGNEVSKNFRLKQHNCEEMHLPL